MLLEENIISQYLDVFSKNIDGSFHPIRQIFTILILASAFSVIINLILIKLPSHFSQKNQIWSQAAIRAIPKPAIYLIWYLATIWTLNILTKNIFDYDLESFNVFLNIGIVLAFSWFLIRLERNIFQILINKARKNSQDSNLGKLDLLRKITILTITFFTIFLLLEVTGRSAQTLIAFGGIGGLALAFASQQMISNFFGGLMVYTTQPFVVGEWVELPEKKIEGHIEEIGWYLTCIRNFDKRPIYVPNSIFTQTIVINPSRMTHERFHYIVELRPSDVHFAKEIIQEIKKFLLNDSKIDRDQSIGVYISALGPPSLNITISAYFTKTKNLNFSSLKERFFLNISEIITKSGAQLVKPIHVLEISSEQLPKNPSEEEPYLKINPTNSE